VTRPHESPECRCAGCVAHDDETVDLAPDEVYNWEVTGKLPKAVEEWAVAKACEVARASLASLLRPPNVKIGRLVVEGEGYAQTITAEVTVDWEPPDERTQAMLVSALDRMPPPRCGHMFGGHEWRGTVKCECDPEAGHGTCCDGPERDQSVCDRAHARDE
jgi:hypothetical protein